MKIGILGGSGLYELEGMQDVHEEQPHTPFGAASDKYVCGTLAGCEAVFLPRHGRGHRLLPSEIDHRANIMGFKKLGVEKVISVSAVGSLKENLHPRDIVLPDQYFDRTKKSLEHTFFGKGVVAHISFAEPACAVLRRKIAQVARETIAACEEDQGPNVHTEGTYVNMEGPAFSTRAESNVYRSLGFDVIGMTSLGEAKLCREAEMCYQAMAMVTDYDCWRESEEAVNVEMLIGHLKANTARAKVILEKLIPALVEPSGCGCGSALQGALFTPGDAISTEQRARLDLLISKYL